MRANLSSHTKLRILAGMALATGWLFYLYGRAMDPTGIFQTFLTIPHPQGWHPVVFASLPSLLHGLSVLLVLRSFDSDRLEAGCWFVVCTYGYEASQNLMPSLGRFDVQDMLAVTLMAPGLFWFEPGTVEESFKRALSRAKLILFGLSIVCSVATSGKREHGFYAKGDFTHKSVCMSRRELRESFAIEAPRPLRATGRIYLKDSFLFVSEPGEGVHVFNNADPSVPAPIAFLKILGNTDLVAKDNTLYADSATDLLVIQLTEQNVDLLQRKENIFTVRLPELPQDQNFRILREESCEKKNLLLVGFEKITPGGDFRQRIERNK